MCWYKNENDEKNDFPANLEANKVYELIDVDLIARVLCVIQCYFDKNFYHKVVFVDVLGR